MPALHLRVAAPLIIAMVMVGVGTIWAATQPAVRDVDFIVRAEQKIDAYDVVRYRGAELKVWIPRSGRSGFNTATLATIWVVVWSAAAAFVKERE